MKADLKESLEHLESTAQQKVMEAVSKKMDTMFTHLKESPLWNNTQTQIREMTESLSKLETHLYEKLKQPGVDLIEVGVEIGLRIEKILEEIKAVEQNVDNLRMNNAEWDPDIDFKIPNLFESLKILGISPVAAQALKTTTTGIQAKILKAINETQKSYMLQPIPDQNEVRVFMLGVNLSFKVDCDMQFINNFSVTTLKDVGTFVTGGIDGNQNLTKATFILTFEDTTFKVDCKSIADSPYPHSGSTLYPYNNDIVISVAGDDYGNKASWYNAVTNSWTALPNMIHQRSQSPVVVVGGSTLYVVGGDINATSIDFLKLKEQKSDQSYGTNLAYVGAWGTAQTNLDGQVYFGRRVGPPDSKSVLLIGNLWWYNFEFGQSYNYTEWGGSQQLGVTPGNLSQRNLFTVENENKEARQLYLANPNDLDKVFTITVSPCSISQIPLSLLEQ